MCIGLRTCLRHFDCQMASRRWSGFRSNGTSWCRRPKAAKLRWTANARCGAQAMQRWGWWDHKIHHVSPEPAASGVFDCWYLGTRMKGYQQGLIQQTRGSAIRGGTYHSPKKDEGFTKAHDWSSFSPASSRSRNVGFHPQDFMMYEPSCCFFSGHRRLGARVSQLRAALLQCQGGGRER